MGRNSKRIRELTNRAILENATFRPENKYFKFFDLMFTMLLG
jgi:hypothetical protein